VRGAGRGQGPRDGGSAVGNHGVLPHREQGSGAVCHLTPNSASMCSRTTLTAVNYHPARTRSRRQPGV